MTNPSAANEARLRLSKEGKLRILNPQEKFEAKVTRKTAIDAKCFSCVGGDSDPGWQWEIGNCIVMSCPLRHFRPYQSREGKPAPKGRGQ